MVILTLDLCVSIQGYDMLLFMSKVTSPRGLTPSSSLQPSGSFACSVVRAHVHCLELTFGFSLCLRDNDLWAIKPEPKNKKTRTQKKKHPTQQQQKKLFSFFRVSPNKSRPTEGCGLCHSSLLCFSAVWASLSESLGFCPERHHWFSNTISRTTAAPPWWLIASWSQW